MIRVFTQSLKIVAIAAMALLVLLGAQELFTYVQDDARADNIGARVRIDVAEDDAVDAVAAKLTDADLIRSELYFTARVRLAGAEIVPGRHNLKVGMSVPEIVDELTGNAAGGVPAATTNDEAADETTDEEVTETKVTIIEGWRTEQIAAKMEEAGLQGGAAAFMEATKADYSRQFTFLADRPDGATLEGYLFPDTYTISSDMSAEDAVAVMLQTFDAKFTPDMREKANAMGLSIFEVVTFASIVEREAQARKERPVIAAVYLNRFEIPMPLQADPTVQYVVGTEGDWWPEKLTEEQLATDSPYNTYLYEGLPPGPIANPGQAALQGVLTPDDNDYIFFVAKQDGTGEHIFAVTYDEQLENQCTYLGACGEEAPADGAEDAPADEEPPIESTDG